MKECWSYGAMEATEGQSNGATVRWNDKGTEPRIDAAMEQQSDSAIERRRNGATE